MFDPKKFFKSFHYAARGIFKVAREEQNFRVELAAAAGVAALMFLFELSGTEKAILTLAIALVLVLELLNSIFERMVDLQKPRLHPYVEDIKDIMAGTVFAAAIGSVIIAVLIFGPHLTALI